MATKQILTAPRRPRQSAFQEDDVNGFSLFLFNGHLLKKKAKKKSPSFQLCWQHTFFKYVLIIIDEFSLWVFRIFLTDGIHTLPSGANVGIPSDLVTMLSILVFNYNINICSAGGNAAIEWGKTTRKHIHFPRTSNQVVYDALMRS